MLKVSVNIQKIKNFTENLKKKINDNYSGVKVGYFQEAQYPSGIKVSNVAFWNNFGTKNIPSRPFLNNAIKRGCLHWRDVFLREFKRLNDMEKILYRVGLEIQNAITDEIDILKEPPLKPQTIKQKKSAKPLINTAFMKNSAKIELLKK